MFHLLFPQFVWVFPMFLSLVFLPVSYFTSYAVLEHYLSVFHKNHVIMYWLCKNLNVLFAFFFGKQLGQASALKIADTFKLFGAQSCFNGCLVVWPRKLCLKECNNLQDPKSILKITDFKIFWIRLLRKLNLGELSVYRSNHQRCSVKEGVLKRFTKSLGKQLCESLFFK